MPTITLSFTDLDFERASAVAQRSGYANVQAMLQGFVEEASAEDLDFDEVPSRHLKLLQDSIQSAERGELIPAHDAFDMARAHLRSL